MIGDGARTTTHEVPASDLPAFGRHTFTIPFDASGQAWVRFAAWDTAGNGAMTMPVRLGGAEQAAAAARWATIDPETGRAMARRRGLCARPSRSAITWWDRLVLVVS